MVGIRNVPADKLIERVATWLKENVPQVKAPDWASFVKSGSHVERPPQEDDFWHVRGASILRKIYLKGPIGVGKLKILYGGGKRSKKRGKRHLRASGGSIIRELLHQLEEAGLVKTQKDGRVLTSKGRSLLDKMAAQIKRELEESVPGLKKYR